MHSRVFAAVQIKDQKNLKDVIENIEDYKDDLDEELVFETLSSFMSGVDYTDHDATEFEKDIEWIQDSFKEHETNEAGHLVTINSDLKDAFKRLKLAANNLTYDEYMNLFSNNMMTVSNSIKSFGDVVFFLYDDSYPSTVQDVMTLKDLKREQYMREQKDQNVQYLIFDSYDYHI